MGDLLKRLGAQFLRRVAEEFAQRLIDPQHLAGGRHERHTDRGKIKGTGEAGFACVKCRFERISRSGFLILHGQAGCKVFPTLRRHAGSATRQVTVWPYAEALKVGTAMAPRPLYVAESGAPANPGVFAKARPEAQSRHRWSNTRRKCPASDPPRNARRSRRAGRPPDGVPPGLAVPGPGDHLSQVPARYPRASRRGSG